MTTEDLLGYDQIEVTSPGAPYVDEGDAEGFGRGSEVQIIDIAHVRLVPSMAAGEDATHMEALRAHLQRRLARIIRSQPTAFVRVHGGYTPTARWLVRTSTGQFFAKIGTTDMTARMLRREFRAYDRIRGSFMPELVGWEDDEAEPILVIADLSTAFWPPPWSMRRVELVLETLEELHRTTAPLPAFDQVHGAWKDSWQAVAADPGPFLSLRLASSAWLTHALATLLEAERSCTTGGEAVTHWDIRSDNICIEPSGVKLVDWPEACLSNPHLDLGFWLPSLAAEGGPDPEAVLPDTPAVAAWVAGFFASRAGLPRIPDSPRVRLVQRQQLKKALPWAARSLGLPLPEPCAG